MAGAQLSTLEAISKEIYEGKLRDQLGNECTTLNRIKSSTKDVTSEVGGKYVTFPIHVGRNAGIGARNENDRLPDAGHQKTVAVRTGLKYLYGAMELTGQAIELIDTNPQAFISSMDLESNKLRDDLKKDLNRQVYGDGSGTIGVVATVAGSVITVANEQWFQVGMVVDIINPATGLARTGSTELEIVDIDEDTQEVTFGAAINAAVVADDVIVRHGSYDKELTGLAKLIGTGTLFNVNPANVPVWKSTIHDAANAPVSEGMFDDFVDRIRKRGAGLPTAIYTHPAVRRAYAQLLQQQRQFVKTIDSSGTTSHMTGGYSGISYVTDAGEIPFVSDYDAPVGQATFVNEKHIKQHQHNDWSFMDRDGSKWKQVPGYDKYEARLYKYSELGVDRRNAHGRIENIATS